VLDNVELPNRRKLPSSFDEESAPVHPELEEDENRPNREMTATEFGERPQADEGGSEGREGLTVGV